MNHFSMKKIITKSLFILNLFNPIFIVSGAPRSMPSVADVFGGLSEQQIAEQVQMGQQFLEDLQKNGSRKKLQNFNDYSKKPLTQCLKMTLKTFKKSLKWSNHI